MVKIVVSARVAYIIAGIFTFVLIMGGVYAFGGINPAVMGHSQSELRPSCSGIVYSTTGLDNSWDCILNPPNCTGVNKVLHYNSVSKAWSCITLSLS